MWCYTYISCPVYDQGHFCFFTCPLTYHNSETIWTDSNHMLWFVGQTEKPGPLLNFVPRTYRNYHSANMNSKFYTDTMVFKASCLHQLSLYNITTGWDLEPCYLIPWLCTIRMSFSLRNTAHICYACKTTYNVVHLTRTNDLASKFKYSCGW